jgi:hypothetical protein
MACHGVDPPHDFASMKQPSGNSEGPGITKVGLYGMMPLAAKLIANH